MHFCQSQLLSFLRQDNSCILKSDLEPLSSSRLLQLPIYRLTKSCEAKKVVGDAIGASAIEADAGNGELLAASHSPPNPLCCKCALSSSFVCSAMAVTPVSQPPGPHLWIPLICSTTPLSTLCPVSVSGRTRSVCLSNWSQPL